MPLQIFSTSQPKLPHPCSLLTSGNPKFLWTKSLPPSPLRFPHVPKQGPTTNQSTCPPDRYGKHTLGSKMLLIIIPLNRPWQAGVNLETCMLITHEAHNTWIRESLYSPTHWHSFIFQSLHLSPNGIIQHNRIFSAQTHLHFKRTEKDGLSSCRWRWGFFSLTAGPGIYSFISSPVFSSPYTHMQNSQHPHCK